MENNITTTLTVEGNQQTTKRNPIARFFSAANRTRKKIVTSITTMVTMAMATAVTALPRKLLVRAALLTVRLLSIRLSVSLRLGLVVSVLLLRSSAVLCSLSLSRMTTQRRKPVAL